MLLSLRTDKVTATLDYIKGLELASGGIRGWGGSPAYPEVSGYLIPTLLDYGERELAARIADWLVSIQNDDGSFCDMDGQKRSFDTAAVMEGLERIGYYEPALKARRWVNSQFKEDGLIRTTPGSDNSHLYTLRISGLLNDRWGVDYWKAQDWTGIREHYIAYALEGLWSMGEEAFVKDKLRSRNWVSNDVCANYQFAILFHQSGLTKINLAELLDLPYGEIDNSWTAKWMLDMWRVVGD